MTNEIKHEKIVLVAYPGMTALDMLGPQTIFCCMIGATVMIAAQTRDPVTSDTGLKLIPDVDFDSCPRDVDLFLLPGGLDGTTAAMKDRRTIEFVGELGAHSKYVTSVCTGSLILGTAGLLKGYRATSHWVGVHMLRNFGATPVQERVVVDRNRITGAGVTAGMDMALTVVEILRGKEYAQMVALLMEYDPAPPVDTGSPQAAGAKLTDMARDRFQDWLRETQSVATGFIH
jgi:cyclohexyl-isocyanide hydratase